MATTQSFSVRRDSAAIIVIDQDETIRLFSAKAEQIFNIEACRAIGSSIRGISPELASSMCEVLTDLRPARLDCNLRKGVALHGEVTPLQLGATSLALATIQTVEELAPKAASTPRSPELYRHLETIIESSFDGIWICDGDGKTLKINRAAAKYNGAEAHEVVGRRMQELVERGLFDRAATLEALEKRAAVTIVQDTRAGYRLLTTATPIFNQSGAIALVFTNERDISELSRMQRQIEDSYRVWQKRGHVTFDEQGLTFLESHGIVARSEAMHLVLEACQRAAKFDVEVLLSGESGSGKGVLAKFIHTSSDRCKKPFIRINCGSIPETLMEAELFGYERGAFTGARSEGKKGLIEAAQGGTLFLDEVGELPLSLQVKLLAFLDDHEVLPIGAIRPRKSDARVIAATNRDLALAVSQGTFREDLWFRLNVLPVEIPALRDRTVDIPPLVHHFLNACNRKYGATVVMSPEAIDTLCRHPFPGNVRELRNIVERMVVIKSSGQILRHDLPRSVLEKVGPEESMRRNSGLRQRKESIERQMLVDALTKYGSQTKAAAALGLDQSSVSRKIRKYKLTERSIVHRS